MSNGVNNISLSVDQNPQEATIGAIRTARHTIRAVVYKFDDNEVLAALLAAHERGVEIQILLDEKEAKKSKSRGPLLAAAGAGTEVRAWPRAKGKLHAKFVIFDGNEVFTGSYNWTRSGAESNIELLMKLRDQSSLERFEGIFATLWEQCSPLKSDS